MAIRAKAQGKKAVVHVSDPEGKNGTQAGEVGRLAFASILVVAGLGSSFASSAQDPEAAKKLGVTERALGVSEAALRVALPPLPPGWPP